ncbi:hypothetical protein [Paenarthrobacter ureafaciens]|uniref:hypothetical protein n=1 Tax=Paenarthrobacter ureafaciens TaxID=37931 RepID=UPI00226DFFE2|nr:hypothetical protein [Paenarthrobacter ureafaciens]MCY0975661.1 hypothetical protein [Paenarthrobacter ureafaciens]
MPTTKNPQTLRGKVALWASVLVVFVVAILLVMILVKPSGQPEPAAPVAVETPKDEGSCNVSAGDTSAKPAMPKDLRWKAEKGWTWPVSDTYGPTKTKDGYGVCFARSPLGAALTAVSLNASSNTRGLKEAIELYVMESPGKAVYRSTLSESSKASTPVTYSGFIVDSFTPDEAQLTLVIATDKTETGYAGIPQTFKWVDGDWKLKVLDDGKLFAGQTVTPRAGQFVTWGGTNG